MRAVDGLLRRADRDAVAVRRLAGALDPAADDVGTGRARGDAHVLGVRREGSVRGRDVGEARDVAWRPLGSDISLQALRAPLPLRALRSVWAGRAGVALGALRPSRAGESLQALRALRAGRSRVPSRQLAGSEVDRAKRVV